MKSGVAAERRHYAGGCSKICLYRNKSTSTYTNRGSFINKLSADDVMHEANTMYDQWPTLPSEDKRKVMEALVEKVTIGNGEIDITFSCVPSSEDVCKSQQKLRAG